MDADADAGQATQLMLTLTLMRTHADFKAGADANTLILML
jgi:hypothetical protein